MLSLNIREWVREVLFGEYSIWKKTGLNHWNQWLDLWNTSLKNLMHFYDIQEYSRTERVRVNGIYKCKKRFSVSINEMKKDVSSLKAYCTWLLIIVLSRYQYIRSSMVYGSPYLQLYRYTDNYSRFIFILVFWLKVLGFSVPHVAMSESGGHSCKKSPFSYKETNGKPNQNNIFFINQNWTSFKK